MSAQYDANLWPFSFPLQLSRRELRRIALSTETSRSELVFTLMQAGHLGIATPDALTQSTKLTLSPGALTPS